MSVYVRLGIRLLYKGLGGSSMEKKRSRITSLFNELQLTDRSQISSCLVEC